MSLNIKYENMNNTSDNIVPLGNSEIKSILKSQSEAIFVEETKMISNNSGFVKKSLIDLAIEFEKKALDSKSEDNNSNLENTDVAGLTLETTNEDKSKVLDSSQIDKASIEENISDESIIEEKNTKENEENVNNDNIVPPIQSDEIDISKIIPDEAKEQNDKKTLSTDHEDRNVIENPSKTDLPKIEETEQALNSVRNAVSKSINNSIEETENNLGVSNQTENNSLNETKQDMDYFKNIFSELSSLTEKLIHENIENKIIEIASELAGYQIDKMPDKYDKKIKTFLKSINRFEEKMSIETNDKDYEALLKIENFKSINETIKFTPNPDISRGDIILNCDGMHYSEKTIKNN